MASAEVVVRFTAPGVEQIAEMISYLHQRNQELERALTAVQEESTRQVQIIRELQARLGLEVK